MPAAVVGMAIMPILGVLFMVSLYSLIITYFTSDIEHHIVDIPTFGKYDRAGNIIEPSPPIHANIWAYAHLVSRGEPGDAISTRTYTPLEGIMAKVAFPGFGGGGVSEDNNVRKTKTKLLEDLSWQEPRYKSDKGNSIEIVNNYINHMPETYLILACAIQEAEIQRTSKVESGNTDEANKYMTLLHVDASKLIKHYYSFNEFGGGSFINYPNPSNEEWEKFESTGNCSDITHGVKIENFLDHTKSDNVLIYNKNTIGLYQIMSVAQSGFDGSTSPIRDLYDFFAYYSIGILVFIAIISVIAYWFKNAGFLGNPSDKSNNPKNDLKTCIKFILIIIILPFIWDPIAHLGEQIGYLMQNPINPLIYPDGSIGPSTSVRYVLTSAGVNLHDQWGLITNMFTIGLSIFTNPQAAIDGIMNQVTLLLLSFVRLSLMAILSMSLFFVTFSKIIAVTIVLATLPIWLVFQALPRWLDAYDSNGLIEKMRKWGKDFNYTILTGSLVCGPIMGLIFFIGEQTLRAGLFGYMEIIQWAVALMFMGLAMSVIPAFIAMSTSLTKASKLAEGTMLQGTVMAAGIGTAMVSGGVQAASEAKGKAKFLTGIGGALGGGGASLTNTALADMSKGELGGMNKGIVGGTLGKKGGGGGNNNNNDYDDGKGSSGGGGGGKGSVSSSSYNPPALSDEEQQEFNTLPKEEQADWMKNRNEEHRINADYADANKSGFLQSSSIPGLNATKEELDEYEMSKNKAKASEVKFRNILESKNAVDNGIDVDRSLNDYARYEEELEQEVYNAESTGNKQQIKEAKRRQKILEQSHKQSEKVSSKELSQITGKYEKPSVGESFTSGLISGFRDGSGVGDSGGKGGKKSSPGSKVQEMAEMVGNGDWA